MNTGSCQEHDSKSLLQTAYPSRQPLHEPAPYPHAYPNHEAAGESIPHPDRNETLPPAEHTAKRRQSLTAQPPYVILRIGHKPSLRESPHADSPYSLRSAPALCRYASLSSTILRSVLPPSASLLPGLGFWLPSTMRSESPGNNRRHPFHPSTA